MRFRVNFRCEVISPARRASTLEQLERVVESAGVSFDVEDGPIGSLGLPFWTTIVFSAEHGDYEALRATVLERIEASRLSSSLRELKA